MNTTDDRSTRYLKNVPQVRLKRATPLHHFGERDLASGKPDVTSGPDLASYGDEQWEGS
jgi:hypothetical protein